MCLTVRHDFGLDRSEGSLSCGMTEKEREFLHKDMSQLYDHHILELKIGHDRYEKVRKLNPRQFLDLWTKCLMTDAKFDEEIDNC